MVVHENAPASRHLSILDTHIQEDSTVDKLSLDVFYASSYFAFCVQIISLKAINRLGTRG